MTSSVFVLSDRDRVMLESWTRSSTVSAGQRERAEIVLAVAGGAGVSATSRALGVSRPTVIKWRDRFACDGVGGLADLPRAGRPKTIDDALIIAATLETPPASLSVTHWSSRLLGRHLGISDATVARAWRAYRVQPWRRDTFKFSTDPALEAKVRDVVGLYLNPPTNAIVLCVDEKSQIQALDRTQPILPCGQLRRGALVRAHGKVSFSAAESSCPHCSGSPHTRAPLRDRWQASTAAGECLGSIDCCSPAGVSVANARASTGGPQNPARCRFPHLCPRTGRGGGIASATRFPADRLGADSVRDRIETRVLVQRPLIIVDRNRFEVEDDVSHGAGERVRCFGFVAEVDD